MSRTNPANVPRNPAPKTLQGRDVRTLGPSDSSDTGADMAGPGLLDDDVLGLDRGTNEDSESGRRDVADAGASVGDRGMDDTSDRSGTGERMTAGKEQTIRPGADIDTDRVVDPGDAGLGYGLDEAEQAEHDPVGGDGERT
jgi:hypothetical protein